MKFHLLPGQMKMCGFVDEWSGGMKFMSLQGRQMFLKHSGTHGTAPGGNGGQKRPAPRIFRSNCVTWIVELDTSTTLAAICLLTDESCECCECSLPVQWARHAELSTSDDLSTAAIHNFYIAQMNFGGPWFRLSNFVAVVQFHLLGGSFAYPTLILKSYWTKIYNSLVFNGIW